MHGVECAKLGFGGPEGRSMCAARRDIDPVCFVGLFRWNVRSPCRHSRTPCRIMASPRRCAYKSGPCGAVASLAPLRSRTAQLHSNLAAVPDVPKAVQERELALKAVSAHRRRIHNRITSMRLYTRPNNLLWIQWWVGTSSPASCALQRL